MLLAAASTLRAQQADAPPLNETTPSPPAIVRARSLMVIGAGRPDQALTLLAATANVEERSLAATGAALSGQAAQGPLATLATLAAAHQMGVAPLPEAPIPFEPDAPKPIDKAEPLLAHMIQGIKDDKPLPSHWNQDEDEQRSYNIVLFEASRIPAGAFAKGARKDITYAHLLNHPSKYRGQIVHLEGTLRQLTRLEPPTTAKSAGVNDLYEGWVFDPQRFGADPWCIVFTELPAGIAPGEKLNYSIAFDGYFFKRYLYQSRNTNKAERWRKSPLLIGRTVTLLTPPAVVQTDSDWAGSLVPIFLALVVGSITLAFGLGWWFRRGDQSVRRRVAAATDREFIEPHTQESGTTDDGSFRIPRTTF
jgi:hypothetical protein